jgi:hypothetical protein
MKYVSFSEPMYGNGQHEIVRTGQILAALAHQNRETRPLLYTSVKEGYGDVMRACEDAFPAIADTLFGGHSGASWAAVRWAAVNLINGYAVTCERTTYKVFWNDDRVYITERNPGKTANVAYLPLS